MPVGRLPIGDISGVEKVESHRINITRTKKKPLVLIADSTQQQEEWCDSIEFALYTFRHGEKYEKVFVPI